MKLILLMNLLKLLIFIWPLKFLKTLIIPEKDGGNTVTFLANFHYLYNNVEINDSEEIKNLNNYS